MVFAFDESVAVAGLLDRRYIARYPFSVTAGILDLETGSRLRGVTSDLSLPGCFVCTNGQLEVRARVRLTLAKKKQKVEISWRRSGGLRRLEWSWSSWISILSRMQFCGRGSRASESLAKTSARQ
jgi:PilZ domain